MKLTAEQLNQLAVAIWRNYNDHRRRNGKPVEYESYDDQPADLVASNIAQAQDIQKKVEALGYQMVLADDCLENDRVMELSSWEIEHLSELEHDRWIGERLAAGWTFAPGDKDVEKKTSPYLIPWDELNDEIKEYDREPVREMLSLIGSAGLAVRRGCCACSFQAQQPLSG